LAFTYSWSDGIELVRAYGRNIPVDKIDAQICDAVSAEMWAAYPWRDTCTAIPPFMLFDDQQDYDLPPLIWKLVEAQITRLTPAPGTAYEPLNILKSIPSNLRQAHPMQIRGIAMDAKVGLFRLSDRPYITGAETFQLDGLFQRKHERVTDIAQDMWFDDQLYQVAQEGLLYWGYKLGDRAQAAENQYKVFRMKIKEQAMIEDQGSGDSIYPAEGSIGSDCGGL
jgi:hypothetical protein